MHDYHISSAIHTLEVDVANEAICLGDFYEGILGYDVLYEHNKALGPATIVLPWPDYQATVSWLQKKLACIAVTHREPQEATVALMLGS